MYDEFEAGMISSDHVKVEVIKDSGEKTSLVVNPVGQFSPGGCIAFVSVKKDAALALKTGEELFEMLLNRIYFENMEVAVDLPDCIQGFSHYRLEVPFYVAFPYDQYVPAGVFKGLFL